MTGRQEITGRREEIRADALSALWDLLEWHLPEDGWAEVEEILNGLPARPDLTDPAQLEALDTAAAQLELAGPLRTTDIKQDGAGVPGDLGDRVNKLIHALDKPDEADRDTRGAAGAGR
jgi:CATRA-Associated Small Protein